MKILVSIVSMLVISHFRPTHTYRVVSLPPRHRRAVDGTIAKFGEYPYVAKIQWYWRKPKLTGITCSATAISVDFVITAARCYQLIIEDQKKRDDVKLEVNLTKTYGNTQVALSGKAKQGGFGQKRTGVLLLVHSAYLHVSTMFDVNIALVKLNSPWKIEPPITIPALGMPIKEDTFMRCAGVGVGRTAKNDKRKRVNWFKASIGGLKYCKHLQFQYNKRMVHFDKFYMCVTAVNSNQDLCSGDLGGALICNGLLAGIMSQRVQDYECQVGGRQFTLYTSVGSSQVFDWLKGYIPNLVEPLEIVVPDPWNITTKRP